VPTFVLRAILEKTDKITLQINLQQGRRPCKGLQSDRRRIFNIVCDTFLCGPSQY